MQDSASHGAHECLLAVLLVCVHGVLRRAGRRLQLPGVSLGSIKRCSYGFPLGGDGQPTRTTGWAGSVFGL